MSHDPSGFAKTVNRQQHEFLYHCWEKALTDAPARFVRDYEFLKPHLEIMVQGFYDLMIVTRIWACIRLFFLSERSPRDIAMLRADLLAYSHFMQQLDPLNEVLLRFQQGGYLAALHHIRNFMQWSTTPDIQPPDFINVHATLGDESIYHTCDAIYDIVIENEINLTCSYGHEFEAPEERIDNPRRSVLLVKIWVEVCSFLTEVWFSKENTDTLNSIMGTDRERGSVVHDGIGNVVNVVNGIRISRLLYKGYVLVWNTQEIVVEHLPDDVSPYNDRFEIYRALHLYYKESQDELESSTCLRALACRNMSPVAKLFISMVGDNWTTETESILYQLQRVPSNKEAQGRAIVHLIGQYAEDMQSGLVRRFVNTLRQLA